MKSNKHGTCQCVDRGSEIWIKQKVNFIHVLFFSPHLKPFRVPLYLCKSEFLWFTWDSTLGKYTVNPLNQMCENGDVSYINATSHISCALHNIQAWIYEQAVNQNWLFIIQKSRIGLDAVYCQEFNLVNARQSGYWIDDKTTTVCITNECKLNTLWHRRCSVIRAAIQFHRKYFIVHLVLAFMYVPHSTIEWRANIHLTWLNFCYWILYRWYTDGMNQHG